MDQQGHRRTARRETLDSELYRLKSSWNRVYVVPSETSRFGASTCGRTFVTLTDRMFPEHKSNDPEISSKARFWIGD